MGFLLTTLVPALLPAVSDGFRSLIGKITGTETAEPKTTAEKISLIEADTKKMEALAKIDAVTGMPSQWVTDLRGAFRYVAAAIVLSYGFCLLGYLAYTQPNLRQAIMLGSLDFVQSAFFFAFGDRVYRTLKGK
jgi:hypothetical protein